MTTAMTYRQFNFLGGGPVAGQLFFLFLFFFSLDQSCSFLLYMLYQILNLCYLIVQVSQVHHSLRAFESSLKETERRHLARSSTTA
jgi:hypothetical protein